MDLTEQFRATCPPEALFEVIEDLGRYPDWLTIVARAEPDAGGGTRAPAWVVELRGRVGPLARSKRLRMERTLHDPPLGVRFERRETDGRAHSPWVMDAEVSADPDGAVLTMHLHYGGGFAGALLERLLRDEIERSRPRLASLVDQRR